MIVQFIRGKIIISLFDITLYFLRRFIMGKRLLVLALVAMLSPAVLGNIIVDDHFDDGAIGTNTTGIGTGFNTVALTGGSVTESDSSAHLINTINGAARAGIASKEGAAIGADIARFEFQGVSFARNTGNTGTGTTGRTAVGVRGDGTAEDVDAGVATGFWIQFESGDIGETNASWSGTSTLFYESSTNVKTVLATWKFDTLNWDDNNPATMNFTPVLDVTLDLSPTGYSLTIEGDTISNVTGSLSGSYASAGITNELTTGHAFVFNQGEAPGLDVSVDQIVIMEGVPAPVLASLPNPEDGEEDVIRDVILSWTPGEFADTHNVYLGTDFDDVNNAGAASPLLVGPSLTTNSFANRLEFGRTYFWRVDEVNAPPDNTVFKGDVWSFTVEPFAYPMPAADIIPTASGSEPGQGPEKTIDGSGLDENNLHSTIPADMWLSSPGDPSSAWIQYEFDKPYKLHEMLVWNYNGDSILSLYGIKEVTIEYSADGVTWTQANVSELAQASGAAGYAANTTVPFDGAEVKYVKVTANNNFVGGASPFNKYGLSEVRFMHIPVNARVPNPEDGATDVTIDTALSWRPGREAAEHNVYLDTDQQAVLNGTAPVVTVNQASYSPLSLDLGSDYFWRIDEVNNAEATPVWLGDIWSFSTQEYIVVDDFESYNDIPENEDGSNLVYLTWIDGYDDPSTNGSTMGYVSGASMETETVHGGKQSAPVTYDNSAASKSEVTVSTNKLPIGSDWIVGAPETLVLWFHGDPNNADTEQMYVKINNAKVLYDGGSVNIARRRWTQWNIDLAASGVNRSNVTSLTIGFERTGATGGSGTVFIDDIRLYRSAPPIPTPTDPGNDGLVAYYAMENNVHDGSGNGLNGIVVGSPSYVPGPTGYGMAMDFNGDDYVDCGNDEDFSITEYLTVALWVNIRTIPTAWTGAITKGNTAWRISNYNTTQQMHFGFENGSRGWQAANSETELNAGEWYHVCGVYDINVGAKIYINGVEDGRNPDTGGITQNTSIVAIGTNSDATEQAWDGLLDEVMIFNRALAANEVEALAGQ
jgi:hypothetical protein